MLFRNRKPRTGTIRRDVTGTYYAVAPRIKGVGGNTIAAGFSFERDATRFLDEYLRTGQVPLALLKGARLVEEKKAG